MMLKLGFSPLEHLDLGLALYGIYSEGGMNVRVKFLGNPSNSYQNISLKSQLLTSW